MSGGRVCWHLALRPLSNLRHNICVFAFRASLANIQRRLHDNASLYYAHNSKNGATHVLPIYVFDERHVECSGLPGFKRKGSEARTRLCGFWRSGVFKTRKYYCTNFLLCKGLINSVSQTSVPAVYSLYLGNATTATPNIANTPPFKLLLRLNRFPRRGRLRYTASLERPWKRSSRKIWSLRGSYRKHCQSLTGVWR